MTIRAETFVSTPCRRGHSGERYRSSGACVACTQARTIARHYSKRDTDAHYIATRQEYRDAHKEAVKAYNATYRVEPQHKEQHNERQRYYRQKNHYLHQRLQRERRKSVIGLFLPAYLEVIRKRQNDRCLYCCTALSGCGELDHIVPLSRGGTNWSDNLAWTCHDCNYVKRARPMLDFVLELL